VVVLYANEEAKAKAEANVEAKVIIIKRVADVLYANAEEVMIQK
jgi:hypothetical protein